MRGGGESINYSFSLLSSHTAVTGCLLPLRALTVTVAVTVSRGRVEVGPFPASVHCASKRVKFEHMAADDHTWHIFEEKARTSKANILSALAFQSGSMALHCASQPGGQAWALYTASWSMVYAQF